MGRATTTIVVAAIVIEAGRVLVSRRREGSHLAGKWELPGGKVEPGEDPRDALRRELAEELGIDVRVGDVVDVTFYRYAEIDQSVLILFYDASRTPGSPDPRPLEVAALAWASGAELDASQFPPADVPVLAKIGARLRG